MIILPSALLRVREGDGRMPHIKATFNFILGKVIIMPQTIDPRDSHLEFGIGVPVVFVIVVVAIVYFILAI